MDFGAFSIISLIYVLIGVRVIAQIARAWHSTWDRNFTLADRHLVDQAAFFILIPISVALHELGHAVAVWSFGREVVEYGFYGFAGYVAYIPFGLSDVQQTVIAAAGSIVNLLLCVIGLAIVLFKRPPMRAAFNELLIQFVLISGINAFILYPVLDMLSGLNGDWRQMYYSGVPWLSAIIIAAQILILAAGYWIITDSGMRARFARLTDVPPGYQRGVLGGVQVGKVDPKGYSPAEKALHEAVDRVTSGWPSRVTTSVQRFPAGSAVTLQWNDGRQQHVVAARTFTSGITEIIQIPTTPAAEGTRSPRMLHRWMELPGTDELTIGLRVAMETTQQRG